jgi:hypothetical protein
VWCVSRVGAGIGRERTLLGSVRKWTAIERPLQVVSNGVCGCWKTQHDCSSRAANCTARVRTSYPSPASSSPGTACPWWWLSLPSPHSHSVRPARKRSIVSKLVHCLRICCSPCRGMHRRRRSRCCGGMEGPTEVKGYLSNPVVAFHLAAIPHRATLLTSSWTTTDETLNNSEGCTYRHFLALRRATVAVANSCTGSFALRRTLHFDLFRGRVVYPSGCKSRSNTVSRGGRVQ